MRSSLDPARFWPATSALVLGVCLAVVGCDGGGGDTCTRDTTTCFVEITPGRCDTASYQVIAGCECPGSSIPRSECRELVGDAALFDSGPRPDPDAGSDAGSDAGAEADASVDAGDVGVDAGDSTIFPEDLARCVAHCENAARCSEPRDDCDLRCVEIASGYSAERRRLRAASCETELDMFLDCLDRVQCTAEGCSPQGMDDCFDAFCADNPSDAICMDG